MRPTCWESCAPRCCHQRATMSSVSFIFENNLLKHKWPLTLHNSGCCFKEALPRIEQNQRFFTRASWKSAKMFTKNSVERMLSSVCCIKCVHLLKNNMLNAHWGYMIALNFAGVFHDTSFSCWYPRCSLRKKKSRFCSVDAGISLDQHLLF